MNNPGSRRGVSERRATGYSVFSCCCCCGGFIAHSPVQRSLNRTVLFPGFAFVKQARAVAALTGLATLVEFIAHSCVQTSLNSTTPAWRYSLVRQGAGTAGEEATGCAGALNRPGSMPVRPCWEQPARNLPGIAEFPE